MAAVTSGQDATQSVAGNRTARFCPYCGTKLDEGARFCKSCGEAVGGVAHSSPKTETRARTTHEKPLAGNPTERKTVYEGYVHKCPSCGEVLHAFVSNCPSCGYEIRATEAASSVCEFARKIEGIDTEQAKIDFIRTFPVPNAKEDIFEFIILASTNISGESRKGVFDAWVAKFEQSYQKAQLVFSNEVGFPKLQNIYEQTHQKIKKEERRRNAKAVGAYIAKGTSDLPNIIISVVWIISLVVLIILSTVDGDSYPVILFFDLIGGAIIMPFVIKCSSNIPRLVVFFGLSLTIIAFIIIIKFDLNSSGEDFSPLLLVFDIIATSVIVFRGVLKKPKESIGNNDGGNNHGAL